MCGPQVTFLAASYVLSHTPSARLGHHVPKYQTGGGKGPGGAQGQGPGGPAPASGPWSSGARRRGCSRVRSDYR
eukprot:4803804-Prymnesium_polylepis.1